MSFLSRSAVDCVTGQHVAIKKLMSPFKDELHAKRAYREFALMSHVNHRNVSVDVDGKT